MGVIRVLLMMESRGVEVQGSAGESRLGMDISPYCQGCGDKAAVTRRAGIIGLECNSHGPVGQSSINHQVQRIGNMIHSGWF